MSKTAQNPDQHLVLRAERLSASLEIMLSIKPNGIELVCLVADSECPSNHEALTRWALKQLRDPEFADLISSGPELPVLSDRLRRHLAAAQAANDDLWM